MTLTSRSTHTMDAQTEWSPPEDLHDPIEILRLAAAENQWDFVITFIDNPVNTIELKTLFCCGQDEDGRTILHLAANHKSRMKATKLCLRLLRRGITCIENVTLKVFVNQKDKTGTTALDVATKHLNKELIEVLLRYGAEVVKDTSMYHQRSNQSTIKVSTVGYQAKPEETVVLIAQSTKPQTIYNIYKDVPKATAACLNLNFKLVQDEEDPECKDMWRVDCNFEPVTGAKCSDPKFEEFLQTQLLAYVLTRTIVHTDVMFLHPLTQIFLHYKRAKFQWLIWFSILFHIGWSLVCSTYILLDDEFLGTYKTFNSSKPTIIGIGFNGLVISWFLLAFFKEAIEALLWKNCTFYRKQIENWGQWTVLIGMLLVWIIGWAVKPMTSDSNSISLTWFQKGTSGITLSVALLLIIGQINKVESLGIFMEIFRNLFLRMIKLLAIFAPLLLIFFILFKLLMPNKDEFQGASGFVKILVMMIGELNYDEVFHDDESPLRFPFVTNVLFLAFGLTVVILLPNVLIVLMLTEKKNLLKNARKNYLITVLEQIYLIESFLFHPKVKVHIPSLFSLKKLMVTLHDISEPNSDSSNEEGPKFSLKRLNEYPLEIQDVIRRAAKEHKEKFVVKHNYLINKSFV